MEMYRKDITLKVKIHGEEHVHPINSHSDVINLIHADWVSGHNVDPKDHDIIAPGTSINVYEFYDPNRIIVECFIKASDDNGISISYGDDIAVCDSKNEALLKSLSQSYNAPTLTAYPLMFIGSAIYNEDQTVVTEVQITASDQKAFLISKVLESLQYNVPKLYYVKLVVHD